MENSEEDLLLKSHQGEENLEETSSSPPSTDLSIAIDHVTVETLDDKLKNLGLEENENEKLNQNETENHNENENPEKEEEEETVVVKDEKTRKFHYPLRPDEPDCTFYLRTGTCGFGSNCRFNHPPKKKHQVRSTSASPEPEQVVKEKEEIPERIGHLECKYYLRTGGCKFGKACRYNHPREKTVVEPPVEFNFLGLPIRPGERECPFYMRTGSCKFATNCRFHHPDPTAGGLDSGYDRSTSVPLHSSSETQPAVTSWSIPRPSTETVPYLDSSQSYVPVMLPPQGMHSGLDWNGYQAPVSPLYPQEGNGRPPTGSFLNGSAKSADGFTHHLQQMPVDEFPERPGQRECQYFMKTGDCKYRSACRFHHPKIRVPKSSNLSPLGLPLRPDQIICTHYSRYGICKYGAACKFDHPPNHGSSASPAMSSSGPLQYYQNSATFGGDNRMADCGDGSNALIQQSV